MNSNSPRRPDGLLVALEDPIIGLPGVTFKRLNTFQFIRDVIKDPQSVGLVNVTDACVMPWIAPFTCKKPDIYLFWDGVHPTKAGHALLAGEARKVLTP